jgi:hypothetical protein
MSRTTEDSVSLKFSLGDKVTYKNSRSKKEIQCVVVGVRGVGLLDEASAKFIEDNYPTDENIPREERFNCYLLRQSRWGVNGQPLLPKYYAPLWASLVAAA